MFNISYRAAGDDHTQRLADSVNDALRAAGANDGDVELIRLAGDVVHSVAGETTADDLVEVSASGDGGTAGRRTFSVHVTVTPIRASAVRPALGEPWVPGASPFNRTPGERRRSAASTSAASVEPTASQVAGTHDGGNADGTPSTSGPR